MNEDVDPTLIGKRLRRWRDERNLSGPEVAELAASRLGADFTWGDLGPLERGETLPESRQATALVEVFGRSLPDLLGPPTEAETAADRPAPRVVDVPDTRPAHLQLRSPHRPGRIQVRSGDSEWDLRPGDQIKRTTLHDRYGGGRQGGIAPCRESSNVLVFSDPEVGSEHGYFDRWDGDVFLYCGEGQSGDQELTRGNGAILNHRREGRALRVFEGCRGVVRYAGEFEVAHGRPYTWEMAQSTGGGPQRRVVMFRLVPVE